MVVDGLTKRDLFMEYSLHMAQFIAAIDFRSMAAFHQIQVPSAATNHFQRHGKVIAKVSAASIMKLWESE